MQSNFDETKKLLSVIMEFVSRADNDDLKALIDGTAKLTVIGKTASKQPKRIEHASWTIEHIKDIAHELSTLESREAGVAFLENRVPTRKALEALARLIDMPVRKEDNLLRLRDRVIDQTIGSRLNSLAIRGDTGRQAK